MLTAQSGWNNHIPNKFDVPSMYLSTTWGLVPDTKHRVRLSALSTKPQNPVLIISNMSQRFATLTNTERHETVKIPRRTWLPTHSILEILYLRSHINNKTPKSIFPATDQRSISWLVRVSLTSAAQTSIGWITEPPCWKRPASLASPWNDTLTSEIPEN